MVTIVAAVAVVQTVLKFGRSGKIAVCMSKNVAKSPCLSAIGSHEGGSWDIRT